jgi:hypothetical protein
MQKFTRVITREIELGDERLALTFSHDGISVRPIGTRKQPHSCSWASVVCHLTRENATEPTPEEIAAAVANLRGGKAGPRTTPRESEAPAGEQEAPIGEQESPAPP